MFNEARRGRRKLVDRAACVQVADMKLAEEWAKGVEIDFDPCTIGETLKGIESVIRQAQADALREINRVMWVDLHGNRIVHPSPAIESLKAQIENGIEYMALCVERGAYNASEDK